MSLYYQGIAQHTDGRQVAVSGQPPRLFATRKDEQGATSAHELTHLYLGTKRIWGWLSNAAKQAILAAFGQTKRLEVIAATNAYLDTIALTDEPRAKALAQFVDEDLTRWLNAYAAEYLYWVYDLMPWLGVDVWIRNANSSYFRTGVSKAIADQVVEETYCKYTSGGGRRLTGVSPYAQGYWGVTGGNVFEMNTQGATDTTEVTSNPITQKNFARKDYISGKDSGELQLFALRGSYSGSGIFRLDTKVYKNGEQVRWYVPFIRNGIVGYLNLLDGTMAARSGAFTIEYTLPDGTPWTPGTPIP